MNTCTFVLVSVLSVGVYAQENSSPCTIHPNGAALDHVPFAAYGDHTTCAEFIKLKTCTFVLVSVLAVGVYAQENSSPFTICPNGAALEHVPFAAYGDHPTHVRNSSSELQLSKLVPKNADFLSLMRHIAATSMDL